MSWYVLGAAFVISLGSLVLSDVRLQSENIREDEGTRRHPRA